MLFNILLTIILEHYMISYGIKLNNVCEFFYNKAFKGIKSLRFELKLMIDKIDTIYINSYKKI